jgi:uncharacterized membrane protein
MTRPAGAPRGSTGPQPGRLGVLDAARGLALLAMAAFHLAWDLSFLGFIATDVASHPGWRLFSHAIAGSFLALAGLSLALAHAGGIRWPAFWRRLGLIAAAALLVTVATRLALPQSYVLFGILHAIALGSVLALPFLGSRWWLPLLLAPAVAGLPTLLDLPAFDDLQNAVLASEIAVPWTWSGLSRFPPETVDFVPVFPWFAAVLAGIGAGRWLVTRQPVPAWVSTPVPAAATPLVWAGRRSLPIYLVHQPLMLGMLMLLAWWQPGLTPALEQRAEATFREDCITECRASRSRDICLRACSCVVETLRRDRPMHRRVVVEGRTDDASTSAIATAAGQCFRTAEP